MSRVFSKKFFFIFFKKTLDKPTGLCYTIIRKREGGPVSAGGLNPRGAPKGSRGRAGKAAQTKRKRRKIKNGYD